MAVEPSAETLRETVRAKYAERALRVGESSDSCCGATSCSPITSNLYGSDEVAVIPEDAIKASLGCGNPTALASLAEGEVVLDLGSGGGIDVLLSARRVGPTGFAYGLDMTDEMLALAEKNRREQGAENVTFLKGHIEEIPLPENAVDVVISNCVINLSADKGRVIREAFRVLKPGGRFAVSDVVVQGSLPPDLRADMEAWVGCIAGALEEGQYRRLLTAAGFDDVDVEVTRVYDVEQLAERAQNAWSAEAYARFDASGGRIVSAFVRARKPSTRSDGACCAPTCCPS
jgi:ubiquinone/menaquinone biosynthesis C-methylase UbiE